MREITPEEIVEAGKTLVDAGFPLIEVPLNSPRSLESIARLADVCGEHTMIGAGPALTPQAVDEVAVAGGG